MARNYRRNNKPTYGKAFKKRGSRGKYRKGTLVRYKYQNGRRVGCVKAPSRKSRR